MQFNSGMDNLHRLGLVPVKHLFQTLTKYLQYGEN